MSGVHITAAGFIECSVGLNVTSVVLEALCWQPVKVSSKECSKSTHQLGDASHPSELFLELTAVKTLPLPPPKSPNTARTAVFKHAVFETAVLEE